jgi:hypothetical protein
VSDATYSASAATDAAIGARHPGRSQTCWKRWCGGRCIAAARLRRPGRCPAWWLPGRGSQARPSSGSQFRSFAAVVDREVFVMAANETSMVQVRSSGGVPAGMPELARRKVEAVLRHVGEPVLFARVMLSTAADPAVERPAIAWAIVSVNGRVIRPLPETSTRTLLERGRPAFSRVAQPRRVRCRGSRSTRACQPAVPARTRTARTVQPSR